MEVSVVSAKDRVRYKCMKCGTATFALERSSKVAQHRHSLGQAKLCPASDTVPRARYVCKHCGATASVNVATRRVSDHYASDNLVCAMAGALVDLPSELELLPAQQSKRQSPKTPKPPKRKRRSVWTVSGGLPTLGKRR